MELLFEGPDDEGTITLKGDLVIQHASRLGKVLLETLETNQRMCLRLEELKEIDLSCLQVFCSAHRTAVALQKEMSIAGKWPEALGFAAEEAGFTKGMPCTIAKTTKCLWKTGGLS
jgi:ABC-type transporter Mla MlaB component